MNRERAAELIAKLLQMAEGGTQAERVIAIEKARRLMEEHGLSEADCREGEVLIDEGPMQHPEPPCWRFVANILQRFFHVRIVFAEQAHGHHMVLLGRQHHLAIARHLERFLTRSFEVCWTEWCLRMGKQPGRGFLMSKRTEFYAGMMSAIIASLRPRDLWTPAANSLVPADDPGLDAAVAAFAPGARERKGAKYSLDTDTAAAGFAAGAEVRLSTAVAKDAAPTPLIGGPAT